VRALTSAEYEVLACAAGPNYCAGHPGDLSEDALYSPEELALANALDQRGLICAVPHSCGEAHDDITPRGLQAMRIYLAIRAGEAAL
jgi:hypothetical protein